MRSPEYGDDDLLHLAKGLVPHGSAHVERELLLRHPGAYNTLSTRLLSIPTHPTVYPQLHCYCLNLLLLSNPTATA